MRTSSKSEGPEGHEDPWSSVQARLMALAEIEIVVNREDLTDMMKVEVIKDIITEIH